jgi:PAS domain S-box-containing protein
VTLWHIAAEHSAATVELLPAFDYKLGWIAGLLAMVGGYALFPAIERVRSAPSNAVRRAWLFGGALTMSIGFWGMHWMAMVGFQLPTGFGYNPWIAIAGLLPAALGCAAAIHVLAAPNSTLPRLLAGALVLAIGMAAMQFSALDAFEGDVIVQYDPVKLATSLVLGYGFSFCALYTNLVLSRRAGKDLVSRLAGSTVIGVAMLAVHFSGLAAVHFHDNPALISAGASGAPAFLIPAITFAVVVVVSAFALGSIIDARLDAALGAMRDSEARHRAASETMLDAHLITDAKGIIRFANPAAERMFGYTAAELLGQPIELIIAKTKPDAQRAAVRPAFTAGHRQIFADGARRKDGSPFPVEVCISEFNAGGERHYSGVMRDLTHSWAADTQMRRLAAAMEHAGEAIAILDADHVICYVNPQYERQTGFTADEVIGHKPGRNVARPDAYNGLWETVSRGETWTGQIRSRRRDNSMYDEELTVAPVLDADGRIAAYVAIIRDISQRVAAERERARLAEALEHASDVIEILDGQGAIIYVNPAYEKRTGHALSEIRGSRPEAVLDYSRDQAAYDDMRRTIALGRPWTGLLRSVDFEGRLVDEEVSVTPMRNSQGEVHSYVVVKRDVTERRALEAQLQSAQKLEAFGLLAGGIGAEIDTPVRQLGESLRLVSAAFDAPVSRNNDDHAQRLRATATTALATVAECVERISLLAKGMRDIAAPVKSAAGLDLNRAIETMVTLSAGEWRPVAELRTELDPTLPPVNCVASDINMVVLNVIVNAAHAIGEKAGGRGLITVATRRLDNAAEIRISDTGTGIAAEIRERIFDPRFTTKGAGKGTGIGLALTHEVIVRQHGGSIGLESEPGVGSTFILRIPLDPATSAAAAA